MHHNNVTTFPLVFVWQVKCWMNQINLCSFSTLGAFIIYPQDPSSDPKFSCKDVSSRIAGAFRSPPGQDSAEECWLLHNYSHPHYCTSAMFKPGWLQMCLYHFHFENVAKEQWLRDMDRRRCPDCFEHIWKRTNFRSALSRCIEPGKPEEE